MERKTFETEIDGRKLIIETGRFAGQANGACTVQYGETVVLATAVIGNMEREGVDYFPLLVDYEERLYAAGKIKGSRFIKREGRPSDEAILTSRLVDRTIRPLFDERMRRDVQVVLTVLSSDQENDADILSVIAASAALVISPIPWNGPVAGTRVGRIDGTWVLNPSYEEREKSDLDLVVCGNDDKIIMIEAGGNEIEEEVMKQAIQFGHKNIKPIITLINEVKDKVGLEKITIEIPEKVSEAVKVKVENLSIPKLDALLQQPRNKKELSGGLTDIQTELNTTLKEDNEVSKDERTKALEYIQEIYEKRARALLLEQGKRVDGRKTDEIRALSSEAGILPRTHGSGLFQRGETQILSVVTLGSPGEEQFLDTMELSGKKRYMHHYNFPGFSVGEVKPLRGPGRREIGHGALAEKALVPVLPKQDIFPYTIRVVSEVLASNGSTSQASICGSSLALMDAAVPISSPVAGIAMGLVSDENDASKYMILTDIQGVEDHNGDMDFKVAGTTKGITAMQMDTKLQGIIPHILDETLEAAKIARKTILDNMSRALAEPRKELSPYAPRITAIKVDPDKIRTVIGKGGEMINKIIEECGGADVIKIDIEDDGTISITSNNSEMSDKAKKWIEDLTKEIKIGEIYEGKVVKIVTDMSGGEIGAIVEILPGRDGMVHISEFSSQRIDRVSDQTQVGDTLKVKVVDIDKEKNRLSLSVKALTENFERSARPRRPQRDHRSGGSNNRRPIPRRRS